MAPDKDLEKILSNTYTKTEAYERLLLLSDFLETISYSGSTQAGPLAPLLLAKYSATDSMPIATAVAGWGEEILRSFMGVEQHEKIRELKNTFELLPQLTLYVPGPLPPAAIVKIGVWCREHAHPQALLTVRIDSSSAGGCFFVWKDIYYDFSLTYFMQQKKEEIITMLGHTGSKVQIPTSK